MKINSLYNKQLENGNIHTVGFMVLGIMIGALLGALYGTVNVLYFEQTESGRYAIYGTCSNAVAYQDDQGTSYNCIKETTVAIPLGQRIKDQAYKFAFVGGAIGFGVGGIVGNSLWNRWLRKRDYLQKVNNVVV